MEKSERLRFFEEWLRAYADHLHLVRQGTRVDLVQPADSKPPISAKSGVVPQRKTTNS